MLVSVRSFAKKRERSGIPKRLERCLLPKLSKLRLVRPASFLRQLCVLGMSILYSNFSTSAWLPDELLGTLMSNVAARSSASGDLYLFNGSSQYWAIKRLSK